MGQTIYGKDINLNNKSKIINMLAAVAAGQPVEYQQHLDALALKLGANKVVTDIDAVAGNVPDAPTVKAHVTAQINALIDGADPALDTLKELADWANEHEDLYNALVTQIDGKIDKTSISSDITTAVTGEVPDAAALWAFWNTMSVDVAKTVRVSADLVADTNLEVTHDREKSYRDLIVQVKDATGNDVIVDVLEHDTDQNNKIFIKANATITGCRVVVIG